MRIRIIGLCLAIIAAGPLDAQVVSSDAANAIDSVFADIATDAPGCACGVIANQALTFASGYGVANLDYGIPITPASVFYLGSVSKQFTAAAVAHAARAGRLSLDDPLRTWVPELPAYADSITVRQLVHHTSGLRDFLGLWSLSGRRWEDVHTADETLALIARQKDTNFTPGDEYLYSNTGYLLLGTVIERAAGMGLRDYMQTHFLDPLGMHHSRFSDDRSEVMRDRAIGYNVTRNGTSILHPWNYERIGAGGMYSSINDLVNWDRNWYTEEVGGAGFTEQLLQRGVLNDGTSISYAFGLQHGTYRRLTTIAHDGALAGFRTALLRFPEQKTTVIVLCNFASSDPGSRARRVADVVLSGQMAPVAAAPASATPVAQRNAAAPAARPSAADVRALVGDYYSDELDAVYRIRVIDDELMLEISPEQRNAIVHADEGRFRAGVMLIAPDRSADSMRGFTIDAGRVRGIHFRRTDR